MEFQVNTNNVILAQINQVESGEYNVTECRFIFSSEYEGLTKIAVFTGANGDAYKITILNNKCEIPSELLTESQIVQIGVYAYEVQGTEFVLRYSPMPTRFMIEKGSYVVNAVNMSRPTPTEVEQLQSQITHNANDIEDLQQTVSEHTTDISNIQSDINDIKAEQTEQNTKIQKNTDDIVEINQNINEIDSHINAINEDIDNLEQDLTNYSLITETGSQINLNVNSTNYQITAILKDKNGNVIYTSNAIDLPIESMIVNARYDNTTKEIVLTLQNGNTLRISVADLVSGLVSETQLQTILANYYNKTEVDNLLSNLAGRVSTNEEDIADIKEEQTTQNTNIEELQSQVETLQEDLESANAEIEELNTDITNMAKAMYKVDGQGTDITLENTSENKFVEFGLSGKTEQEQLSGKNLFDGEIELGSINPANGELQPSTARTRSKNFLKVKPNTTYTMSVQTGQFRWIIGYTADKIGITDGNISGQASAISTFPASTEKTNTFTTTATTEYIKWYDTSSTDLTEKVQIEEGSTATSYEPYCGGIPSPSPDFPQQIKNVVGNAKVKIQNKNLLPNNINSQILSGVTITKNNDGTILLNGTSTNDIYVTIITNLKLKAGTYTLSGNNSNNYWIRMTDSNGNVYDNLTTSKTFIVANDTTFSVMLRIRNGTTINNVIIKPQLEQGSTATSYVPHREQNYPFTFAEGQRGMQGTQPKDDGIHQKHKQRVFDGTETFWNITMAGDIPCFWFRNSDIGAKNNPHNKKCNYFIYSSLGFRNAEINTLCENSEGSATSLFVFKTNVANSIETWKQWLAQQYANGTPVIVEYELAESELENNIIPYNTTQQAQYNAKKEASSYDDITIISSESDELGFNMNVVAVADANKVIESQNNEIDTIKSRLDLLEG